MKWTNSDLKKYRIESFTPWMDIYEFGELDDDSGVFVFTDVIKEVKFIGYANKNYLLEEIANAIIDGKDMQSNHIMVIYTESYDEANAIGQFLIEKYNPENNFCEIYNRITDLNAPRHI